jgi:hypothetical protein
MGVEEAGEQLSLIRFFSHASWDYRLGPSLPRTFLT